MILFGAKTITRIIISGVLLVFGLVYNLEGPYEFLVFAVSYLIVAYPVLIEAARDIYNLQPLNENFLMAVASLGAFAIGEYPEGVAVMLFYEVGTLFESYAVDRSRRSITSLMDIMPESANLKTDEGIRQVSPEEVHIGDIIIIRPGERVPLDSVVLEGSSMMDTSSMTGESVPRRASEGETILSGFIATNGVITAKVTAEYSDSAAARILNMIEEAYESKSRSENFVTKFARYYTPAVVAAALLLAVIPPLITGDPFQDWVYRALTFLVISCPCALVISVPLAFFGGIGGASRLGILVKGGNYLEALANVDTVVFDKTGTLTEGTFKVETVHPVGMGIGELLKYAASAEAHSNHPIAASIRQAYDKEIDESTVRVTEERAGMGVVARVDGKDVLVGNETLMSSYGIEIERPKEFGTAVHVSVDGIYAGYITISDRVRPDSAKAVADLKKMVGNVSMLTGDTEYVGKHVAGSIGIDSVYTDLLPGDKMKIVEELLGKGRSVAFVGDGINDAPSLARSDVGIAMGAMGSDAAIEAADVVIMDDMPSKVPIAIKISKKTRAIAIENIVFALVVKALFLLLGAMGYISMVEAVFADVGVAVIAILNSIRTLKISQYKVPLQVAKE